MEESEEATMIAACMTLYDPDVSWSDNVLALRANLGAVYIVDNSPEPVATDVASTERGVPIVAADGINRGISEALNMCARRALTDGYRWLLTMDQDSRFAPGHLSNYVESIPYLESQSIGMVGVTWAAREPIPIPGDPDEAQARVVTRPKVITSGSAVNLAAWNDVGGFDERFFIDFVDTEFSFHLQEQGYRVVRLPDIRLIHTLGETRVVTTPVFRRQKTYVAHQPYRYYYTLRNYRLLSKLYRDRFPRYVRRVRKYVVRKIRRAVLYDENRREILRMAREGLRAFRHRSFGKL